jgi:hypothetical protein
VLGKEGVEVAPQCAEKPVSLALRRDLFLGATRIILTDKIQRQSLVADEAECTPAEGQKDGSPIGIGYAAEEATDLVAGGIVFESHAGSVTGRTVESDPIDRFLIAGDQAGNLGENITGPAGGFGLPTG